MNNTINESAIKKLKLLITVVDRPKGEFYLDVLGQYNVNFQMVTNGQGTANSQLLELLGLEPHKAVILSVVREDLVEEIMNCLEDKFHSVRGGKGILSGWFIAWTIDWRIGLLIGVVFFVTYLITKYVSLGSVLASITFAVGFAVFQHDHVYVMAGGIFMGALCVFMHRANILRLIRGEERKTNLFGKGNKS